VSPSRLSCGAVVVAGLLLVVLPAAAGARVPTEPAARSASEQRTALALLDRAASAADRLDYRGTQHVTVWRDGVAHRTAARLEHDPLTGSVVLGPGVGHPEAVGDTAVLDPRVVDRLAAAYTLSVRGPVRCAGRTAAVVEARRTDGRVAGRFWVDRASGLLLRREVYDGAGRRARRTTLVDLSVRTSPTVRSSNEDAERPAGLERLQEQGWPVTDRLPGGFRLLEARLDDRVLQLAYTDGLSTLSVFAQPGRLDGGRLDGFTPARMNGWPVLVDRSAAERVVWSDGQHVYTLVSDAPEPAVRAVVGALPHDADRGGVLARLERGAARLAGMLNPMD